MSPSTKGWKIAVHRMGQHSDWLVACVVVLVHDVCACVMPVFPKPL